MRVCSSNKAVLSERRPCQRCGEPVSRRNLSKHRAGARCKLFATLPARSVRKGFALKGRRIGRHPSLGPPAAPAEFFIETPQAQTVVVSSDATESVSSEQPSVTYTSCCETCQKAKKGMAYCRTSRKHTAPDCKQNAVTTRKSSSYAGVGWCSQKVACPPAFIVSFCVVCVCVCLCVVCVRAHACVHACYVCLQELAGVAKR